MLRALSRKPTSHQVNQRQYQSNLSRFFQYKIKRDFCILIGYLFHNRSLWYKIWFYLSNWYKKECWHWLVSLIQHFVWKMSDLNVRQTAIVSGRNFNVGNWLSAWNIIILRVKTRMIQLIGNEILDRIIIREKSNFNSQIIHHHVFLGFLSSTFCNLFLS